MKRKRKLVAHIASILVAVLIAVALCELSWPLVGGVSVGMVLRSNPSLAERGEDGKDIRSDVEAAVNWPITVTAVSLVTFIPSGAVCVFSPAPLVVASTIPAVSLLVTNPLTKAWARGHVTTWSESLLIFAIQVGGSMLLPWIQRKKASKR